MEIACSILHNFSLVLFFALPVLVAAQTANISLGSSLVASEDSSPWHSPSKEFAFGFRRIGDQNLFLLAIWFDAIPDRTIVWYANDGKTAPEGSKLELGVDGQFTLTTPQGKEIWKPDNMVDKASYAAMLDTGNFILADNDSNHIWESFRDPTDTILPTQIMERGGLLSSRRTENNYEKGRFQLRLLPDGNLVLNPIALPTDNAYGAYYNSDTNDIANDTNSGFRLVFNESGYLYVVRRNGNNKNLTSGSISSPQDFYYRATLDVDGIFTQYAHPKSPANGSSWVQSWTPVWFEPKDICSGIKGDLGGGVCGFNSYCILQSNGRPTCQCLPGFSLFDQDDKFSGCKQDNLQTCDPYAPNPEELYETKFLSNLVWRTSANYEELGPSNEVDCRDSCISDCNCVVAVTYAGKCWKKKLPLSSGMVDISTYGKVFIKIPKANLTSRELPSPESINQRDQATAILVISIILGISVFLNLLFMAASSIAFIFSYHKRQKHAGVSSILETNLRSFTFENLKNATDGFREELGRGAFGIVYKGILSSPSSTTLIAVKKLNNPIQDGEKEFVAEASAIAKTHHKNLVRLLGFCEEGQHRLLVYEFMSNGTLASFLFGISKPDWNKRVQIAFGIARGLAYLHEECGTQIIHCDIKPQNILLDDSFTARISDFGLAKLLMNEQTRTLTAVRGTKGYVAPEWFRNMPITAKVDVYSFGVMLLEIIFCRKSLDVEKENEEEVILVDWVYDCYRCRRLDKLVENDEEAKIDMRSVERFVMVAIWCIQEDPSLRPSMKMVTQMIEGVVQVSMPPCPCPFSSFC
ncbi:G-type lectin S-receptor-like serine/threonine-protein kinase LECRK3 [Durio zibethinus]|uniref:Receptor-like serine/threonine-protein kinase n=1 Tax=Durio zibethinus TaxID=66656 RepID=A0A6P6BAD9_DURZI|nr:G-type lectin S-receptor-like serine/threonine-protein kinase LECRK3 [Durio zibethinus]